MNRSNIIEYNKYIKNTLLDITSIVEYAFNENSSNNYKEFSLLNYDNNGTKEINIINLPNYINNKINNEIGDLKNFFSFQNDAYILNYTGDKNTLAIRANTLIQNYNYFTDEITNKFTNIIECKEINNTNDNYNAISIEVDFSDDKLYTIEYAGLLNETLYTDRDITVVDNNSILNDKSKTYTLYDISKGSSIPKYTINGAILSLPAGLLLSSINTGFNIRKKFDSLEINSPTSVDLNTTQNINIEALDKISLNTNKLNITSSEVTIGTNSIISIVDNTIEFKIKDNTNNLETGELIVGDTISGDLHYIVFNTNIG